MITNPFTGVTINAKGDNQYSNPDGPAEKKYVKPKHFQLQDHLMSTQMGGQEVLDHWSKDPEFASVAMKTRHHVNVGSNSEKKLKMLVKAINRKRKFQKAQSGLFGNN